MEDDKTTIVEKRVSRGIIRRRVTQEPKEEVMAAPAAPSQAPAAPAQTPTSTVTMKTVAPAFPGTASRVHAAGTDAAANVVRNLRMRVPGPLAPTSAETTAPRPDAAPTPAQPPVKSPVKPQLVEPRKLTFMDRIKGTITLQKVQPPAPRRPATSGTVAVGESGSGVPLTPEEEAAKKEKAIKAKKGVKVIGGDLDIEGLGRATNIHQLVRTVPVDRVFRPGPATGQRRKKIISKKSAKSTTITQMKASKRVIEMQDTITVGALAQELGVKAGDVIKYLMNMGEMVTINHALDFDTATLVAGEYQYQMKNVAFNENALLQEGSKSNVEATVELGPRPPVVTVMGHVDHGKTTLLDSIRSTNVTGGEAGGITQHIGAYTVDLPEGRITFLDTPGHEAFTAIRARGSQVTDIVILVVAADDGVMPQTLESIDHAKAANVPIIVAVNKIDKEGADLDRITRQLSEKGLVSEAWGGDTIFVPVSALKKQGIQSLLENILLQAEVLQLQAAPKRRASGTVIEAKLDRFRGPVCTFLVQDGTLKLGDPVVVGTVCGKVRAMNDWKGGAIGEAGPALAVEVLGLEAVPNAGDKFNAVTTEQDAKEVAEHRIEQKKIAAGAVPKISLEDMFAQIKSGKFQELALVLKTDVQGSLEAIRDAVMKIGNEDVKAKVISSGVGGITESDVTLAGASKAIIIGFNVRPETAAIHLAKEKGVDIRMYKVIYDLANDVKLAMQGLLAPTRKENYLGRAEVKQVFEVSKLGFVAGSQVVDGIINRNANLRLLRDNVMVFEGKIASLKRFKDDAREVKKGLECGVGIEGFRDIKAGDVIEAFEVEMVERTL